MNLVAQPVPAASCGSVPLLARTPSETPGELAGADACATVRIGSSPQGAISESWTLSMNRPSRHALLDCVSPLALSRASWRPKAAEDCRRPRRGRAVAATDQSSL